MKLRPLWVLQIAVAVVAQKLSDGRSASGLLGTHFGVPGLSATYDFVVVGGGTAGLALARRLAADSSLSVAVIEAGDFYEFTNGNSSQIPAFASRWTGRSPTAINPSIDWLIYSTPQPQLDGITGLCNSGKMIAGSSGRSFLWQMRGTHGAFDKWADQVNDSTYKLENFFQYYQRPNRFHIPTLPRQGLKNVTLTYNESDWVASGGPIQISFPAWINPISSWIAKAFPEIGISAIDSFTGGRLLGWSWVTHALDPALGIRSSAEQYLREAFEEGSNLVLYKSTLAKKVLFKDDRAKAVQVTTDGAEYVVSAKREIIISSGAMRSPQLLMVSGIGPASILDQHNIHLISERSGVGQNLWDIVIVGPTYKVDLTTHDSIEDRVYLTAATNQFLRNRTGILTNSGGDIGAFEQVKPDMVSNATFQDLQTNFTPDWPHLEYMVLDAYFGNGSRPAGLHRNDNQHAAASVGLMASFSRGNVTLNSSDMAVNPVVSPNWLQDVRDQELAIAAFKRGRDLFTTKAMKSVVGVEVYPGTQVQTDAEILAVCRESANSAYNMAGTNKMGVETDPAAVVDSTGRVFGTRNLRVVDASILPFIPHGQLESLVFALAEKIAEDILDSHHKGVLSNRAEWEASS